MPQGNTFDQDLIHTIHMQRYYGPNFITLPKHIIHWWFIDFNTWQYDTLIPMSYDIKYIYKEHEIIIIK